MASHNTAPSCCMILCISVALLMLLPQQAHGATVIFTYCNPLDAFNFKYLVTKIDMELARAPVQGKEPVAFQIELGDGIKDEDLTGEVTLSFSTFLPSGELLSSVDETVPFQRVIQFKYNHDFWNTRSSLLYGVNYTIVLGPPKGKVLMCAKIVEIPPIQGKDVTMFVHVENY